MKSAGPIKIHSFDSRASFGFIQTIVLMSSNCLAHKELIWQLVKRDFLNHYRKSFLGLFWHFATPIMTSLSWMFLFKTGVVQGGTNLDNYPAYVFIGALFWNLFVTSVTGLMSIFTSTSTFIAQVEFPHEILIIKQLLEQLLNFSITFIFSILVILLVGSSVSYKIIFLPAMLLPLLCLCVPIGLFSAVLSVIGKDFAKFTEISLSFLFFLTPIAYKQETLSRVANLNPLTHLVGEMRNLVLFGEIVNVQQYMISSACSIVVCVCSLRFFFLAENKIIEKLL